MTGPPAPHLGLASARLASASLAKKSRSLARVLKTGRTHLQDAVPMTFGQEFGGYAANLAHAAADHRLVMAFALVGLGASGATIIEDAGAVAVSYPAFARDLARLTS